jgi:hypothetical protein
MEQSPSWKANSYSASQEIPCILQNSKVHYSVHKCSLVVSNLSQMHAVHNLPPFSPKIQSNIIFTSMSRSSKWFFLSGFL